MPANAENALQPVIDAALAKAPQAFHLGFFGGTFDPPHVGHVQAACAARDQLGLDAVLFVPACTPVYKLDQYVTPAEDRLAMVKCAIQGQPGLIVSDIEIARGGKTYTADTLRQLKGILPENVQISFIAGIDAALTIPVWKESQVIQELAHIAVVARPGYVLSADDDRFNQLTSRFTVSIVDAATLDAASSQIRELIQNGQPIDKLVPATVAAYAGQHGLYRARKTKQAD